MREKFLILAGVLAIIFLVAAGAIFWAAAEVKYKHDENKDDCDP